MMSGYGWDTDAKVSSTDKLNYSTDVKSSTSIDVGTLAPSQAFANSGVAGYRAGGSGNGGQQSTIQKIAFTNDAVSSVAATLSGTKTMGGAFANSGTAGYIAGGVSSGTTTTNLLFQMILELPLLQDFLTTFILRLGLLTLVLLGMLLAEIKMEIHNIVQYIN
jgi:hypothetical protein